MTANPAAVKLALAALGSQAHADAALGARTTYRVGGTAAVGFNAQDETDLNRLAEVVAETGLPVLFVGLGSNLLVADAGFDGIAVHLSGRFAEIEWPSHPATEQASQEQASQEQASQKEQNCQIVKAGAAVPLPVLARQCAARSLGGMGWAVGVPGSVGGAVRMNAGGHGSDIASCLLSATVFDLSGAAQPGTQPGVQPGVQSSVQPGELDPAQLGLGYRTSAITEQQVVTAARFICHQVDKEKAQSELKEIAAWRRQNQPGGQNAGSVFKNPEMPASAAPAGTEPPGTEPAGAGALIDSLGLKGLRVGGAHVSQVHANFIVADTNATAADVVALIDLVAQRVSDEAGVQLRTEVRFVGFRDH